MNDTTLRPDDPKLTAYALGELHGDERAAVEAALRENPALRLAVDEVRATAQQLEAALAAETLFDAAATETSSTDLNDAPRLNGHAPVGGNELANDGGIYRAPVSTGKLIRFPQFYYVISGVAAACFAVLVTLNRDEHATKQQARETEARIAQQKRKAAEGVSSQSPIMVLTVPFNHPGEEVSPTPLPTLRTEAEAPKSNAADRALAPVEPARPLRSIFLDRNLNLAEQHRPMLFPWNVSSIPPGASGGLLESTSPGHSGTVTFNLGAAAGKEIPSGNESAPASTVAPRGELVAGSASGAAAVAPADEIVFLDTFTVTADQVRGFNAAVFFDSRSATRGIAEPQELPRPPPGAQFARSNEVYAFATDNAFMRVANHPLSTFAVDVDTASYANVRRFIENGALPPRDAVRIEELLNYFPYHYPAPVASRGEIPPFAASLEVAAAPWAPTHRLVRIGLKSREVATSERAAANLVFLVDVSGSMADANKLPLVKESMKVLVGKLRPDDRVAIVVTAGASGIALPSTPVAKSRQILDALEALQPAGSTNGAMGIQLAYDIARANFQTRGINRVILCTDGDFNVGTMGDSELVQLIEAKAGSGVVLTVLGFGMGNYKDATLERLANKGKGHYGHIDSRGEARNLLVEKVSGTLVTVAKDVKIQVEFNPARVSSYRLIGYENQLLRKEDFNNDKMDAGETAAGHTMTALYEVVPVGAEIGADAALGVNELKYQAKGAVSSRLEMPSSRSDAPNNEMLTVSVRYKRPDGFVSRRMEFPLVDGGAQFVNASADFQFAAAVAQFGMILRDSPHRGTGTLGDVLAWAGKAATNAGADSARYRGEFIELVRKTQKLLR